MAKIISGLTDSPNKKLLEFSSSASQQHHQNTRSGHLSAFSPLVSQQTLLVVTGLLLQLQALHPPGSSYMSLLKSKEKLN